MTLQSLRQYNTYIYTYIIDRKMKQETRPPPRLPRGERRRGKYLPATGFFEVMNYAVLSMSSRLGSTAHTIPCKTSQNPIANQQLCSSDVKINLDIAFPNRYSDPKRTYANKRASSPIHDCVTLRNNRAAHAEGCNPGR